MDRIKLWKAKKVVRTKKEIFYWARLSQYKKMEYFASDMISSETPKHVAIATHQLKSVTRPQYFHFYIKIVIMPL